jgi:hypothetical protein
MCKEGRGTGGLLGGRLALRRFQRGPAASTAPARGNFDRAVADYTESIHLDRKETTASRDRALGHRGREDTKAVEADTDAARHLRAGKR